MLMFAESAQASGFISCKMAARIITLDDHRDDLGRHITFEVEEITMPKSEQADCLQFLDKEFVQFVTSKDKGELLILAKDDLINLHFFQYGGMGPSGFVGTQIWNLK
jgi:hypothetical protein